MIVAPTYSRTRAVVAGSIGLLIALGAIFAVTYAYSDAAGTVLVRGIIKPGGDADTVSLYITYVAEAPDPTAIRGSTHDVNVTKAAKYKWQVKSGALSKVRTTSNPTPSQEVVVRGTLLDDNRITASWIVQNYREFTIEGKLQGRTLDSGKVDEGFVTVNVSSSAMRNVSPATVFKESRLKGLDWKFRVNGATSITALGVAKHLDEVTASQQKVRLEGQVLDEDTWTISKLNELN